MITLRLVVDGDGDASFDFLREGCADPVGTLEWHTGTDAAAKARETCRELALALVREHKEDPAFVEALRVELLAGLPPEPAPAPVVDPAPADNTGAAI